jgi:hypothetical protein
MKKPLKLTLLVLVLLFALFAVSWNAMYSDGDPKNVKYLLWKEGIYKLDLDTATGTMIGDRHRDTLVVGKTKAQIEKRFGQLLTPEQASSYQRNCWQNSYWKNDKVLFISHGNWMIVFDGDKATDLLLIKGC